MGIIVLGYHEPYEYVRDLSTITINYTASSIIFQPVLQTAYFAGR